MKLLQILGGPLLLLLLSACTQMSNIPGASSILGGPTTLPIDTSDPCRQQRQTFSDGQSFFASAIITKALQGAASRGMNSLMTPGGISTALSSAVSGGLAGARSGYFDALQQQSRDQQQLAQQINADLQRESSAIDHTTAAFAALRACRLAQSRLIKGATQAQRVNRSEAQYQLQQQHDRFAEEIVVAKNAGINMQKRDDQFAYAASNVRREETGTSTGRVRPQAEKALTVSATETLPQKRNSFESSVKEAQAESDTAFSLDSNAAARVLRYA